MRLQAVKIGRCDDVFFAPDAVVYGDSYMLTPRQMDELRLFESNDIRRRTRTTELRRTINSARRRVRERSERNNGG